MTAPKLYKLIGVTYIFICLKTVFQILFATVFITDGYLKFYSLREENIYSFKYILWFTILYDFFILSLFHIAIFLLLYYIVKIFGNKIWIQVFYISLIYSSAMFIKEHGTFHIEYVIIPILLGLANWWMFKKWIKI